VYFGDKGQLFDAVVARQIEAVMTAVPLIDGDLCAFAAARFDYILAYPQAGRLTTWRTLERVEPTETERQSFKERVASVAAAQEAGRVRSEISAIDLFAIVLRMTDSWLNAPPALKAAARGNPRSRLRDHRAALLVAVRSVTEPV